MDKNTKKLIYVISALTIIAGIGMAVKTDYTDGMLGIMIGASLIFTSFTNKAKSTE